MPLQLLFGIYLLLSSLVVLVPVFAGGAEQSALQRREEEAAMGRPKRGGRRIDAAIDFCAGLGFHRTQIRRVINDLLSPSMYGREGWVFLEEAQYTVVLDKLLEEQAQPKQDQISKWCVPFIMQQQEAASGNEALPENEGQQQEVAAGNEALPENDVQVSPENHMQVSPENHMHVSGVQNKAPTNISQSVREKQASHNGSAFLEPVVPLPTAAQTAPAKPVRPPCHGWISEESESESELEAGEVLPDIPSTSERLPPRRRGASRWDVSPNS
ncbi:hypothetical protein EJB05_44363 [Eragrostis curvula]|uniref:WIYLD domain-containing protein n=1 Tax=Eragrostis curvula TaxID=38414 RepID=A0A5J9TJH3_9POAL|nr:hypothetical protein EJB05_44363 [Eragrostis curvula]